MSENTTGPVVRFTPMTGRERAYDFAPLPCPPLHAPLAAALTARLAPDTGSILTLAAADTYFGTIRRFLAFLSMQDQPLASLDDVRPGHLYTYRDVEGATRSAAGIGRELAQLCRLLQDAPYGSLHSSVWDLIKAPRKITGPQPPRTAVQVYSHREYTALLQTARTDAAEIIARLTASEELLAAFRAAADTLSEEDQATARLLDVMDRTGHIPHVEGRRKQDTARLLFLTLADAAPLFVLALALGRLRVTETADLPSQHMVNHGDVVFRINQRKRALHRAGGRSGARATTRWRAPVTSTSCCTGSPSAAAASPAHRSFGTCGPAAAPTSAATPRSLATPHRRCWPPGPTGTT
ncbi:hypothetical protein ACFQ3Z_26510 [Streptomyces nogalater]